MALSSYFTTPNFLILDEKFSVCDKYAVNQLDKVFECLQSYYKWVIIITHQPDLETKFSNTMEISRENGFSRLVY